MSELPDQAARWGTGNHLMADTNNERIGKALKV